MQDASNSQTEDTNGNLDVVRPISTQPAESASSNDGGVYIQWDAPVEVFSISDAHHTTPEDVLREVGEYPPDAGGGGAEFFCDTYGDPFDSPTFINSDGQEVVWLAVWGMVSCGWKDNETVHLTISNREGEVIISESQNASTGVGFVSDCRSGIDNLGCFPTLNTPLGQYTVSLKGDAVSLIGHLDVVQPTGPNAYEYQGKLILYNFQPNERVRLLSYSRNDLGFFLDAWSEFRIRNNGQLILETKGDTENHKNVIVGDVSGEVSVFRTAWIGPSYSPALSPYKNVMVSRPTDEDIERVDNLWNLVGYKDLKRPGIQTYQITVQPSDELRWGFSWCATNPEILKRIALPYGVDFFVDDVGFQYGSYWAPQMKEIYEEQPNSRGWVCQRWVTLLTNWEPNSQVVLEVRYNLHESIFDGQETYPPGEYRQIIYVNVEE